MTPPTRHDVRRRIDREPPRPAAAPLAVVLMALLAGCAGVAAGLPFAAPPPYTDSGAALNATDLRSAHAAGLDEAGTYRSDVTLVLDGDDGRFVVERTAAANTTADRAVSTSRYDADAVAGDGLSVTAYTDGDVTYRRAVIDAGDRTYTQYDAKRAPYDAGLLAVEPVSHEDAARADLVGAVVADANWTQRGVERYDGGWVTRYEAAGAENFSTVERSALVEGPGDRTNETYVPETLDVDVRAVNATLLVSPDGVVRHLDVHVTGNAAGEPVELTLTVETNGLGETAVERPGWVDEIDA